MYPSRSDETESSVITDEAVLVLPVKIDAEIDTASSTSTVIRPDKSDDKPFFTNGTARYTASGRRRNDGTKSFVTIRLFIIAARSRLNCASTRRMPEGSVSVSESGERLFAASKIAVLTSPLYKISTPPFALDATAE